MDGIHDIGGMDGLGSVDIEDDEAFHDDWEKKIFGSTWTLLLGNNFNLDEFRFGIERMEPAHYLESPYWEHWLASVERLLVEKDVTTLDELFEVVDDLDQKEISINRDAESEDTPHLAEVYEAEPEDDLDPAELSYSVGDEVTVRNLHPSKHTRCPGYVRNHRGTIDEIRGKYHIPDEYVKNQSTVIEPVHSVRFSSQELWGDEYKDSEYMYVDLWERYLK